MNGAHFHLVVNHLPIVSSILGTLVLIAGITLKMNQVKQTGLGIYIFTGITAIAAFLTGEDAEEVVEDLPGVGEKLIHAHEELGETFLFLSIALGLLALLGFILIMKNHTFSKITVLACLILGLGTVVSGKMVGTSGGEIRHSEIRKELKSNTTNNSNRQGTVDND